jgi:hypothetical protein
VLWTRRVEVAPDWRSLDLGESGILSVCPDLRVEQWPYRDGTVWTLLGTALSADPARPSAGDVIAAAPTAEIERAAWDLAGRWLLEPPRVSRRPFGLSHAATAASSFGAW